MRNRFKGIVYRHPDGYQLLYTLWGKVAAADYASIADEIQFMENNFRYIGAYEQEVFSTANNRSYYLMAVFGFLGLLLWMYRKRINIAGQVSGTYDRRPAGEVQPGQEKTVIRSESHQRD